jgi:Tol biopolymer transport system component
MRLLQSIRSLVFAIPFFLGTEGAQIQVHRFLDLPGETSDPSVSPDGGTLAFDWWAPQINDWGIYLWPMNGGEPRLFAQGDDGIAYSPKWSPDGQWIAFLRSGTPRTSRLFVKPAAGGEERSLGTACSAGVAWTADSRFVIAPNNGDTDDAEACKLIVVSIDPGKLSWQLADRGTYPALPPDGKTLAFARDREIRLLPVTRDGHAAGVEATLVRENFNITSPAWVPGTNDIVYLLRRNRSVIRRIDAHNGAKPRDDGSIDGEFNLLAFAPTGKPVLAEVGSHDGSLWRMDLQAHEPGFDKLRQLPWNVNNLSLSPNGQTVLYTQSTRGHSDFYTSNIDGTASKRLFSIPYERTDRPVWSPDGRQLAFTAIPAISQIPPSHLFAAPAANGSPRRLLKQFEYIGLINWSRDGKALFLGAETGQESSIWKLNLVDSQLTRILPLSGQFAEQTSGNFIYLERPPLSLLRIPIDGGPEEPLANRVLNFTVGGDALYYVRQDANPPTSAGLNLYRFDLMSHESRLIARGISVGQLQLSPDERFIYSERPEPQHRDIMIVQNWH